MNEKKRLTIYLAITFALSWSYIFLVVRPAAAAAAQTYQLLVMGCMFFPAACMLLTRIVTREGMGELLLAPRFRGNGRAYLLAYFGPVVLVVLGAAVYYAVFPDKLDWSGGYYRQLLEASGVPYEAQQAVPMRTLLLLQAVQAVLLPGLVNLIPSLGEEWGWRGYMMPKLLKTMGTVPAVLVGGLIWGLWHAPIIALGHNYGVGYPGWPWLGIAAMCLFCIAFGAFLTALTVKTGSCIPAALAHGAFNGSAALGTLVSADGGNPFVGPVPSGILGALPLILAAIFSLLWLTKHAEEEPGEENNQ